MTKVGDRFYHLRKRYSTQHIRKKFPLPDMTGWVNAGDYCIEFYFDDKDVFDEIIKALKKRFPYKRKHKIHFGTNSDEMILFISSNKALQFLIKRYRLLVQ